MRADQIHHAQNTNVTHWYAPLVADAEAGLGDALNAFEIMKAMIEEGVACAQFEDQLSSTKKRGHLERQALVPTSEAIQKKFITLAGLHPLNLAMFELARAYRRNGMAAYSRLQE